MKKLLFTIGAALLTLVGSAQFQGTVRGTVTDSSGVPIEGITVFLFGSNSQVGNSPQKIDIQRFVYADTAGHYVFSYQSATPNTDTIVVGLKDCNGSFQYIKRRVSSTGTQNHQMNMDFANVCVPNICDLVKWSYQLGSSKTIYNVIPLLNPDLAGITPSFLWRVNGNARAANSGSGLSLGQPDTLTSADPSARICYTLHFFCGQTCFPIAAPNPTALACTSSFYVDTVNSINFQGQVVIWNNSSTDTGVLYTNYAWDFGDGNTSSQQYPTHTYADTGIYNVCLTIYTYRGTGANQDTCVDTFCDSIGFDANGNLIYKKSGPGFTINVIDPATVSLNEADVFSSVQLYPNPNNGNANLEWENNLQVEQVRVFNLSGQELRNIEPAHNGAALSGLPAGVYLVNLQTANASKTLRMIVQ